MIYYYKRKAISQGIVSRTVKKEARARWYRRKRTDVERADERKTVQGAYGNAVNGQNEKHRKSKTTVQEK